MESKNLKNKKIFMYVSFAVLMFVLINICMWSTSYAQLIEWNHEDSPNPKGIYFDGHDSNDDVRWSKADGNLTENIGINKNWGFNHVKGGAFTYRESESEYGHSDVYADYDFSEQEFFGDEYWIFDLGLDLVPSSDSPSGWKLKFRYRTDTFDLDNNGEDFKIRVACSYWNGDHSVLDYEKVYIDYKFTDKKDSWRFSDGEYKEDCELFDVPVDVVNKCLSSGTKSDFEEAVENGEVSFYLDEIKCDTN